MGYDNMVLETDSELSLQLISQPTIHVQHPYCALIRDICNLIARNGTCTVGHFEGGCSDDTFYMEWCKPPMCYLLLADASGVC